jgi:esterase/lipase
MEAIIQPAADKVGFIAYINYPFLWLYQNAIFDKETLNTKATDNILNSNIPVLVVQGENDETYPPDKYSVYSHIKNESENVSLLIMDEKGSDGHTNLLFDADGTANDELINSIDDFLKNEGRKSK